tara:strand:- start:685 stop:1053 length:369 start_codon:yes stop_codon:yes gene_type:complete
MCKIYCITDIHGLKYVGSTKKENLRSRLYDHRADKKRRKNNITSSQLDLYNCEIKLIEECDESNRYIREKYWIEATDCVNYVKFIAPAGDRSAYHKQYYQNNSERYARNFNYLLRIDPHIFM